MISTHSSDMQRSFLLFLLFLSQIIVENFVIISGLLNPGVNYANADISKVKHINRDYIGGYRTRTNNEGGRQLQAIASITPRKSKEKVEEGRNIESKNRFQNHRNRHLVNDRRCGFRRAFNTKIVGGEDADPKDFPWLVLFGEVDLNGNIEEEDFACGGSLISSKWVLTASHCICKDETSELFDRVRVKLGLYKRSSKKAYQEIDSSKLIKHEKYKPAPFYENDIGLIKLSEAYKKYGRTRINTICLPLNSDESETWEDYDATVAGWGSTDTLDGGRFAFNDADTLQKITIPIVSTNVCRNAYMEHMGEDASNHAQVHLDRNICAGGEEDRDSCQGDSGGPLMIKKRAANGRTFLVQVGIVSWGVGCGIVELPGVYTNVLYFLEWILDNIGDNPETKELNVEDTAESRSLNCSSLFQENIPIELRRGENAGILKNVHSAEDCQEICQRVKICNFFIWNGPTTRRRKFNCFLKQVKEEIRNERKVYIAGRISGPRSC